MTLHLALIFFAVCGATAAFVIGYQLGRMANGRASRQKGFDEGYQCAMRRVHQVRSESELNQWLRRYYPPKPEPEKDPSDWWKEEE